MKFSILLFLILFFSNLIWGQNSIKESSLSYNQMKRLDRIEWRTIQLPGINIRNISIMNVQRAIEGRCSIIMDSQQHTIAYDPPRFRQYPFLHLMMCKLPPELSLEDKLAWRDFFNGGGTLFMDYCPVGGDISAWKNWALKIYPDIKWKGLDSKHVLSYSFYLLEKRFLLNRGQPSIMTLENDGRSIMILNQSVQLSWWKFIGSHISAYKNTGVNELRLRFYINMLMYILTGNYKNDQLHLPTILLRRK